MKSLIFLIYFFRLIAIINCQQYVSQYVPTGRWLHTATLIEKRIYFLGGMTSLGPDISNEFFYLDISKPFDKKRALPFVDLTDKSSEIPPHFGAATSIFGEQKDSIFFFGGNLGDFDMVDNEYEYYKLIFTYNITQSEWKSVTLSQRSYIPERRFMINAVTDNNDIIYILGGAFRMNTFTNEMIIFDTTNNVLTNNENGPSRVGHTSTFLPDIKKIIYIGGNDMANLDVYNTMNGNWENWTTKNPPPQRMLHTAVLTKDNRILIYGGYDHSIYKPANVPYAVLNLTTLEWHHGKTDFSLEVPFRCHTATLYNDYMFIAFGQPRSYLIPNNNPNTPIFNTEILIYKIGEYANLTEVTYYSPDSSTLPPTSPVAITIIIIVLSIIVLGFVGFIMYRRYKKTRPGTIRIP